MTFQSGDWVVFQYKKITYHGLVIKKYKSQSKNYIDKDVYIVCPAELNGLYYRIKQDELQPVKLSVEQRLTVLRSFGKSWWSNNKPLFQVALGGNNI